MSNHRECPDCGARLDPGESCDCYKEISTKEIADLYKQHGCDTYKLICASYNLGYKKAEKDAYLASTR